MTTALEGLRVLDFTTGLAGAVATMVLCDNGAEVVKVEPPGGDPQRRMPAFAQWHRGKQSVAARSHHLRRPATGPGSWPPGPTSSWRAGAPGSPNASVWATTSLSATNPGLVYCSITGFGPAWPDGRCQRVRRGGRGQSGRHDLRRPAPVRGHTRRELRRRRRAPCRASWPRSTYGGRPAWARRSRPAWSRA